MASGIFGLGEIYLKQVKDSTQETYSNWPEGGSYGYLSGNGPPSLNSDEVFRISLSTDTVSQMSNMSSAPGGEMMSMFDTAKYGYLVGGNGGNPVAQSEINRIDFSAETFSSPGVFPNEHYHAASIQNDNYGYAIAGLKQASTADSLVRRLEFSNETSSSLSGSFPIDLYENTGVQSRTDGYSCGGINYNGGSPTILSSIYKFNFSTESHSLSSSTTPAASNKITSTETEGYGYFAGGVQSGIPYACDVFRLDFSNDTISSPGTNMSNSFYNAATTKGTNYGYWMTGFGPSPVTGTCRIFKLDFSNESTILIGDAMLAAKGGMSAVTNKGPLYPIKGYKTYGYVAGGTNSPPLTYHSNITRIDFSTGGTASNPGNNISYTISSIKTSSSNLHGYIVGGFTDLAPSGARSTVSRLDFASDTVSVPGLNMTKERNSSGSVSTSDYGYYVGGASPFISNIDRHDFATDSITVSSPHNEGVSPSTSTYIGSHGVSDTKYGYFCGGEVAGSPVCTVKRLDFSNDTFSNPGNDFTDSLYTVGRVQNNTDAYFQDDAGTLPTYSSNIFKLQFSNETASDTGNNLPSILSDSAGISADYVGYLCGGYTPPATYNDIIIQLDFTTETATDTGNNLPSTRSATSGFENGSGSGS